MYESFNFYNTNAPSELQGRVEQIRNLPLIAPQSSSSVFSPETIAKLDAIKQQQAIQQPTDKKGANILTNALENIKEIGTGATAMLVNPRQTILEPLANEALSLGQTYQDFGGGIQGLTQAVSKLDNDAINFLISNYGITTKDIYDTIRGDKKAGELLGTVLTEAYKNPVFTAMDIFGLKGLGKAGKATKGVTKTAEQIAEESKKLSPAQKVANALNVSGSELGSSANKFIDKVEEINKGKWSASEVEEAVKAHLTGDEAPHVSKELLKQVGEGISQYDELLAKTNKYGKSLTKEDKFAIADSQAVNTREGNIRSFDEIKRERQPYYDLMNNEGIEALEDLAKGREVELPYKEAELKPLPEMTDNYTKDLSNYTNTLYRETSAEGASKMIDKNVMDTVGIDDLYFANKKDMALGQGSNKGVMLEFDSNGIQGQVNLDKPAADLAYKNGSAEFIVRNGDKKSYMNNIKSVTITDSNMLNNPEGRRLLNNLEQNTDQWMKSVDETGNTRYINRKYTQKEFVDGDPRAIDILKNKAQFDKGYLRIVPMADITDIDRVGMIDREGRVMAGRASDRMYGSATAKQIAETYFTKPQDLLNKQMNKFVEATMLGEIATKGTLGGVDLVTDTTKKVSYINPESTSVKQMVETASDTANNVNKVAIDSKVLEEMNKQVTNLGGSNPFGKGILSDIWTLGKSNMLTSGSYLVGNAQTGFFNAAMDVGLNPIKFAENFVNAWRSNGELAKQAGIFRRITPMDRNIESPVLKGITKYSGTNAVSNMLNYFDSKMQNTFAEMALHKDLAERGIKYEARANALADADALTLAQMIDRAKTVSLMNKTNTILPKGLGKAWAMTNPYWRWADTAMQSSLYMLKAQPQVSNLLLNKFMGNVAFDREMQNRMNLGVQTDRPFVSYRYNPETKQLQEVTAEFMPVMNTLKLVGETAEAATKGDGSELFNRLGLLSVPILTEVGNAIQGKDRYGNPIVSAKVDRGQILSNARTGERYIMTPEGLKPQNMGTGEEILGTTIRSLIGSPNFFNKIVAPTAAAAGSLLSGNNIRYYQPYQNQLVGEFQEAGTMPEYANPRRSSGIQEVADVFTGAYSRNYDPRSEMYEDRRLSPRDYKQLMRGFGRRQGRTMDILRRQGGGI